ncbi:MAG: hypothetical protein ABII00_14080 [Elusimicrobiota bacterium]
MAQDILDTVLLLALPASGKSEVRKYLKHLSPEKQASDFHMGPSAQLDDFPYVHIMRTIDDELAARGKERVYFQAADKPFRDPRDWGTLVALLNEDHANLTAPKRPDPASPAAYLIERIDAASEAVGAPARLRALDDETRKAVIRALDGEARKILEERRPGQHETLAGKTLVIEFARGGADGSSMPLAEPFGYKYSLSKLSKAILEKATILYVWVTPEESRRKNDARADPNDPGSILHHGVPLEVMLKDYGCDDVDWLEKSSERPGTVTVEAYGRKFYLPIARFDNRVDKTSFLRDDAKSWDPDMVRSVHEGLKGALDKLAGLAVAK